jgi:hypothetical protein
MKNKLDRNSFTSFVILIFRLCIIAFIVPFVLTLPLLIFRFDIDFWPLHLALSASTYICCGYVIFKDNLDLYFKDNLDLYTYSNKDVLVTTKDFNSEKRFFYFNSEKQFFYDALNPCPYCDTKFEHTALHCAVYFNDIERLKEVIELIKKVGGVDAFNKIFFEEDSKRREVLDLSFETGNIDVIKFLVQTLYKTHGSEISIEMCIGDNRWITINPEHEESIKQVIDLYKYKKHQTGKDILDKDDKKALVKGFFKL